MPAPGRADRTMVFLAVTAEESGLLGSDYYAANPLFPLAQTAGGINMDRLNLAGAARDFVSIGGGKSELDAYLARAAAAAACGSRPSRRRRPAIISAPTSSASPSMGVPMLYGRGGEDLVNGGPAAGRAAAEDYRANRYHQPSDEYDPALGLVGRARATSRIYYRVGRELPIATTGRTGIRATNSARSATARAPGSRAAMTARQPPEWAPHEFVWIGFPSHGELWETISSRPRPRSRPSPGGPCRRQGRGGAAGRRRSGSAAAARQALAPFATIVEEPFGDIWLRDTGPIVVKGPAGGARQLPASTAGAANTICPATTRSGGGSPRAPASTSAAPTGSSRAARSTSTAPASPSPPSNACSTPTATPACPAARSRRRLRADLGIDRLLWLGSGLLNDHTDGHVDNLARFVAPGGSPSRSPTATTIPTTPSIATPPTARAASGSSGAASPRPGEVLRDGEIIPASYMNFYIGNAAVVVPQYGAANDEAAVAAIAGAVSRTGRRSGFAPTIS